MMNRTLTGILALGIMASAACSTDVAAPQTEFNGIKYTAQVVNIAMGMFGVAVTLQNTTGAPQTRTYRAACQVRIRLYRAADGVLLYDETRWACDPASTATITIDAFSSRTIQSGGRFPGTVLGDSLPHTSYTVYGVVQTEAPRVLEVRAGLLTL